MSLLANDLACILSDTSLFVPVVFGAISGQGRYKEEEVPQNDTDGGVVLAHERSVLVNATVFATLTRGNTVVVNGVSRTVRDLRVEAGGVLMRCILV